MKDYPKIKLDIDDTYPFGKWKGVPIRQMLDEDDFGNKLSIFGKGDGLSYLTFVKANYSNIELSDSICSLMNKHSKKRANDYVPQQSRYSRLEHHNDMGGLVDIGFDELYGPFGY